MTNIESNDCFEIKADELWQKADKMLLVVGNINRQGGIVTQLMMTAAFIELQSFWMYLLNITHSEEKCVKKAFPNRSKLEKYIRHFKDSQYDVSVLDNPEQRIEDINVISNLKEEIWQGCYPRLDKYGDDIDDLLNSWTEQKTEDYSMRWQMLYDILYVSLSNVINEFESIVQIIRAKKDSKERLEPTHYFREYIKDVTRTEEIIEKLHRLVDKKIIDSDALKIITRAMWIGWLYEDPQPTPTSIKAEFPKIKCSDQHIYKCLKEAKPTKNGIVDVEEIERIRQEYEAA